MKLQVKTSYFIMSFTTVKKTLIDGKNDIKEGLLLNSITTPVLFKAPFSSQPKLQILTKAFKDKFVKGQVNLQTYTCVPNVDGEKVTEGEAKWWEEEFPALVIDLRSQKVKKNSDK